jgi:hypothetical protein
MTGPFKYSPQVAWAERGEYERLSMSSPKSPSIDRGEENNEARETLDTFT